jgi:hypothetical protein
MPNRKERRARAARERKTPGYLEAVLREGLRLRDRSGSGLFHVFVQHDDGCDLLNGRGACNCDPDITSRPDRVS